MELPVVSNKTGDELKVLICAINSANSQLPYRSVASLWLVTGIGSPPASISLKPEA
jgi:hypothetical protein